MRTWSRGFDEVAHLVAARAGLSLGPNGLPDAEARIRRAMSRARISDVAAYARLIEREPPALDDLLMELTVGETYFFRDPQHFAFVCEHLVPERRAPRGASHVLRIWSAGCATGEEAYSLAIALRDAGAEAEIVATDLSRAALGAAREATYRRWSLRGVDDAVIARCFGEAGGRWTLHEEYRRNVRLEFHNLAQEEWPASLRPPGGFDLILCRNVMIYLDAATTGRVADRLAGALAEGGWLITGPSDPPLNAVASLRTVMTGSGVFYRRREQREPVPPLHEADGAPAAVSPTGTQTSTRRGGEAPAFGREGLERRTPLRSDDVPGLVQAPGDEETAAARIRALAASHGAEAAWVELEDQLRAHPLSPELHLLRALMHLDAGRDVDAARDLGRVLYLDRSVVIATYLLGSIHRRQRRFEEARRAFRNARATAAARPADEPVAYGDGTSAGTMVRLATLELEATERASESSQ